MAKFAKISLQDRERFTTVFIERSNWTLKPAMFPNVENVYIVDDYTLRYILRRLELRDEPALYDKIGLPTRSVIELSNSRQFETDICICSSKEPAPPGSWVISKLLENWQRYPITPGADHFTPTFRWGSFGPVDDENLEQQWSLPPHPLTERAPLREIPGKFNDDDENDDGYEEEEEMIVEGEENDNDSHGAVLGSDSSSDDVSDSDTDMEDD